MEKTLFVVTVGVEAGGVLLGAGRTGRLTDIIGGTFSVEDDLNIQKPTTTATETATTDTNKSFLFTSAPESLTVNYHRDAIIQY